MNIFRVAENELGVGTGDGSVGIHTVAGLKAFDAVSDALDKAGAIVAGGEREVPGAVFPSADVGFDRVDADGPGSQHDLAGGDGRRGDVFELEDVGFAKLVDSDGLHVAARFDGGL